MTGDTRAVSLWSVPLIAACSIACLTWIIAARALGPSDLWDQTQPKTIAYTTDMLVNGGWRWVLPIERGELPATKPPLYNWLAAPFVAALGFDSEAAHKMPSVMALMACWLVLVRLGRRIQTLDGRAAQDGDLGWLAAMIYCANYATFKLGYLARPDMLLTLWLLLAWVTATRALIPGSDSSARNAMLFWLAVTLAALTKGPAAIIAIAYALLASRLVGGRWSAIASLRPVTGALFTFAVCGAWIACVWHLDPHHLAHELWFQEIYGRVTGIGREGTHHGTREWLGELPYQGAYYMTRFVPWSFVTVIALGVVGRAWWRSRSMIAYPALRWAWAAALFTLVTIGLFTLSVGKRPDYVAVSVPQASLLAGWLCLRVQWACSSRTLWLAPAAAAITLAFVTMYHMREPTAPMRRFGDAITDFASEVRRIIVADRAMANAPVHPVSAGTSPLQALAGVSEPDARHRLQEIIERGEPFWVLAGRTAAEPSEFGAWIARRRLPVLTAEVARSPELPRAEGWPTQASLWRVTPASPLEEH